MTYGSESECATHYTTAPHSANNVVIDTINYMMMMIICLTVLVSNFK